MDQVLSALAGIVEAGRAAQPAELHHAAKRMLLDSVGCAIGGYRERVPAIVRSVSARRASAYGSPVFGSPVFGSPVFGSPVFGSPVFGSPVFGSPGRLHPDAAAFANSVMIRFLD